MTHFFPTLRSSDRMRVVELQNAEFWTFVIFIVGFIPVLGGAVAGLAPPLFALVQFESYWPALILLVGLQLILFVSGNFIQPRRSEEHTSELQSLMRISYAVFCLKKKNYKLH